MGIPRMPSLALLAMQDGFQAARAIRDRQHLVSAPCASSGGGAISPSTTPDDDDDSTRVRTPSEHELTLVKRYYAEIPIIALTAHVCEEDRMRSAGGGKGGGGNRERELEEEPQRK